MIFLEVAKSLNLRGNWEFPHHPCDPEKNKPSMPTIRSEVRESYKTRNWGCLIPFIVMAFLFTLPAFFI